MYLIHQFASRVISHKGVVAVAMTTPATTGTPRHTGEHPEISLPETMRVAL